jgi:hypothetical protein
MVPKCTSPVEGRRAWRRRSDWSRVSSGTSKPKAGRSRCTFSPPHSHPAQYSARPIVSPARDESLTMYALPLSLIFSPTARVARPARDTLAGHAAFKAPSHRRRISSRSGTPSRQRRSRLTCSSTGSSCLFTSLVMSARQAHLRPLSPARRSIIFCAIKRGCDEAHPCQIRPRRC